MGLVFALFLILAFLAIGYYDLMQTMGAEPLFGQNAARAGQGVRAASSSALSKPAASALPSNAAPARAIPADTAPAGEPVERIKDQRPDV